MIDFNNNKDILKRICAKTIMTYVVYNFLIILLLFGREYFYFIIYDYLIINGIFWKKIIKT